MARRTATALSYDKADDAPRVVAQGKGLAAERVVGIAEKCGIEVLQDPLLADILCDAEIGACIPPAAYESVAAIFAFLEKGVREKWF
jgi:flagellar biosynthesis protein